MVIKRIFSNFAGEFNVLKIVYVFIVHRIYLFILVVLLACLGCEWRLRPSEEQQSETALEIDRYDQLERLYLTTGDFAALQQMNTQYPTETRMLIKDVLQLGPANDPEMKSKLLLFFQDSTLQMLINDVEHEFANLSDVESTLAESFLRLSRMIPGLEMPQVYAQISSLDQSIVAGDGYLGISLDKYLGSEYPLYLKYGYSDRQRSMMKRTFIVPDCIGFYLLSLYPLPEGDTTRAALDRHMGKIQYVVNQSMGIRQFDNIHVKRAEQFMKKNKGISVEKFLQLSYY